MENYTVLKSIDVTTEDGSLVEVCLPDQDKTDSDLKNFALISILSQNINSAYLNLEDLEHLQAAINVAIANLKYGI